MERKGGEDTSKRGGGEREERGTETHEEYTTLRNPAELKYRGGSDTVTTKKVMTSHTEAYLKEENSMKQLAYVCMNGAADGSPSLP